MGLKYNVNKRVMADCQLHSVFNSGLVVMLEKRYNYAFVHGFPDGRLLCECSGYFTIIVYRSDTNFTRSMLKRCLIGCEWRNKYKALHLFRVKP